MKLSIKMFPNMTAAVASCCNQLWTIVEILPRINGRAISGEVFDYYTKKRGRYWIPGGSNTGQVLERVSSTVNPKLVVADWFQRCARVPQTDLVNSGFSSVNDAAGGSLYKRRVLANALFDEPNVVIRMRPSTIPDTRNYKWSPKRYINLFSIASRTICVMHVLSVGIFLLERSLVSCCTIYLGLCPFKLKFKTISPLYDQLELIQPKVCIQTLLTLCLLTGLRLNLMVKLSILWAVRGILIQMTVKEGLFSP